MESPPKVFPEFLTGKKKTEKRIAGPCLKCIENSLTISQGQLINYFRITHFPKVTFKLSFSFTRPPLDMNLYN